MDFSIGFFVSSFVKVSHNSTHEDYLLEWETYTSSLELSTAVRAKEHIVNAGHVLRDRKGHFTVRIRVYDIAPEVWRVILAGFQDLIFKLFVALPTIVMEEFQSKVDHILAWEAHGPSEVLAGRLRFNRSDGE